MQKNKKEISQDKILSPEEEALLRSLADAEDVYQSVMERLNFVDNDVIHQDLVLRILKRQTLDHIIFSIWKNLTEKQAKHLRDFMSLEGDVNPLLTDEAMVMQFAMMYPDLKKKVFDSLEEFFDLFVEKFNEVSF